MHSYQEAPLRELSEFYWGVLKGGGVKEMMQMVFSIVGNIIPYVCCA